jgi:hypothetical protein
VGDCVVKGTVLKRGQPVVGAQVACGGVFAQTDAEGKFRLEQLVEGEQALNILAQASRSDGHMAARSEGAREKIQLKAGEEVERTVHLPGGRLSGRVVDSAGSPVDGATVSSELAGQANPNAPSEQWKASEDGSFWVEGLKAGTYQVQASHPELGLASATAEVPNDGDSPEVMLKLSKDNQGTLVSSVLDPQGKPVTAAWCYLDGASGRFTHKSVRDAKGVMTIPNIPPGKYKVTVSYWGYSSSERMMEIEVGKTARIDDVLFMAGAVRWIVQDKSGAPLAGVACTLTPADPNSKEQPHNGTTDGQGQWVVRGLVGGDYTGQATLPGGKALSAKFSVTPGQLAVQTTQE